jgi:hypothetical protein
VLVGARKLAGEFLPRVFPPRGKNPQLGRYLLIIETYLPQSRYY